MRVLSFDVWGTLFRANPEYVEHRGQLIADCLGWKGEVGPVNNAVRQAYRDLRGTSRSDVKPGIADWVTGAAKLLDLATPSPERLRSLRAEAIAVRLQHLPFLTEPNLPEILARHHASGLQLAVVSNTSMTEGTMMRLLLDLLDLRKFIRYELFSDEVGRPKPDRVIFDTLVSLADVEPWKIMHVGDNYQADYLGARHAGLRALHYTPDGAVTDTAFARHSELNLHPLFRSLLV